MADFSQDIYNFRQYGTYTYKFDQAGNMNFNSSSSDFSQVYVSFPLINTVTNNSKISGFYKIEFEEFIPTTSSLEPTVSGDVIQTQMNAIEAENESLKTQLNSLIANSSQDTSAPTADATKQVILELRKALGQGRVDSDFSETFPYTPFRKVTK